MPVYFIRAIGGHGPIKIGKSGNVRERLAQLNAGSPYPLEVLATLPGGDAQERQLHSLFSDSRERGEWFTATVALLAVVAHAKGSDLREPLTEEAAEAIVKGLPGIPKSRGRSRRVAAAWEASGIPSTPDMLVRVAGITFLEATTAKYNDSIALSADAIQRLADTFACSAEWLATGHGEMRPTPAPVTETPPPSPAGPESPEPAKEKRATKQLVFGGF